MKRIGNKDYIEYNKSIKVLEELAEVKDKEINQLQERIDKAIEYIENAIKTGNCSEDISYEYDIEKEHNYYVNSKDLLEILKGDDKE